MDSYAAWTEPPRQRSALRLDRLPGYPPSLFAAVAALVAGGLAARLLKALSVRLLRRADRL